ncbi:MAG: aminopeptidase P family N-terminal domain-containing protein, partial [Candidatus Rokuibacteriota bacterium]
MDFERTEYLDRLTRLRGRMRERGVDLLLLDEVEHLAWVAGWHATGSRYHACLVPLDAEPVMVLRRLDEPVFRERSWLAEGVLVADTEDPVDAVVSVLGRRGWEAARIGVELDSHYLTVRRYEALRGALPRATFVDFAGALPELRLRKSPAEVALLRRAAAIADQA